MPRPRPMKSSLRGKIRATRCQEQCQELFLTPLVLFSVPQLLAGYRALVTPVRPAVIEPAARDLDDDHVLTCALGADAHLIVTRDQDLLALNTFRGIRILAARDELALIATSTS